MGSTIKQRLRRYNGTDYDTVHLETDGSVVEVEQSEEVTNPLNTDQLTVGQHDVYFTAYPDIKWHVDHIDGNYVYLGLYTITETTIFGSNARYSGSTIAALCTTFLNNTIPNVADYLESVTVEGVTNKVFIPTYYQMSGDSSYGGDTSGPVFTYIANASDATRQTIISNDWSQIGSVHLSTASSASRVFYLYTYGFFAYGLPSDTRGFRPEVKVRYKGTRTTTKDLNTAIGDKQNKLTFDTAPTANSSNPVTSGGVYEALQSSGGGSTVYSQTFTASDWSSGTMTIAAATHGITGDSVVYQFYHLVDGSYVPGTWACIESYADINSSTHVITLHGPTAGYAGKVVLVG